MAKRKSAPCPWRANRRFFPYISEEMWQWFESWLGGDGITMRILVMMGSRHARKVVQSLRKLDELLEAGCFVKPKVVYAASEDPRTQEGCDYWGAIHRFYFQCSEERPKTRVPGPLGGQWINKYVTSLQRWATTNTDDSSFLYGYGDPCDEKFRGESKLEASIREKQSLKPSDRLFHCALCLPWGRWVGPWVRDMCGEVVERDEKNLPKLYIGDRLVARDGEGTPLEEGGKRRLLKIRDAQWSHGFTFGFHPTYAAGGPVAAESVAGSDPLGLILRSLCRLQAKGHDVKKIRARVGMFGIGPEKMDDGRLYRHAGPSGKKIADWPFDDKGTSITMEGLEENEHRTVMQQMVEGVKERYGDLFFVKRDRDGYGWVDVLAATVWTLFYANNPSAS